jgi:predicted AlkP superfamily phosphohydrolase/phosphomutase
MSIFKTRKKKRACIIGLDGVPYGMVRDLAANGVMPSLARLIDSGHLHKMKASLPEISAVSWTNFMTGTDSGTHGIFGFTDFKPNSYDIRYPNFLDVKVPTFWDRLAEKGKKSIVINQPSTYPARKINGILISGFVAVEFARAVYPGTYRAALEKMGYEVDIDIPRSRENPEILWQELGRTLSGQKKALDFFWDEPWDVFEFVVTGTDRLHHFLWSAYEDASHGAHQAFLDYYRQVDDVINTIVSSYCQGVGSEASLYVLSDHGFAGIVQEVYLNAWLEENGYLGFKTAEPRGVEDISSGARAFALDPNRVYLNLKSKFPAGTVEASEGQALKLEIAGKLERLTYEGRKVVKKVFFAEDIYHGPLVPLGPDLIVVGETGFDMKGSVKKKEVFGRTSLQGMHTWADAFFWAAEDMGSDLSIQDIAPMIMKNFS